MQQGAQQRSGERHEGHPAVAHPETREDTESEHTQNRAVGVAGDLVDQIDDAVVGKVFEGEDHQRHAEGHRHMDDAAQAGQTSFAVTFRAVKDIDRKRSREGRKGRSCG